MEKASCVLAFVAVRAAADEVSEQVTQALFADPLDVVSATTAGRRSRWPTATRGSSRPTRWVSRCPRTAPTSWSSRRRPTATSAHGCPPPGLRTEPLAAARRKASGEAIAETALMFLDAPYQWGGVTVVGLDCSGLVQTVHRRFGMLLPRNADQQETAGREVSLRSAEPGDLLCYGDHVAIFLGGGEVVHASQDAGKVRAREAPGRPQGAAEAPSAGSTRPRTDQLVRDRCPHGADDRPRCGTPVVPAASTDQGADLGRAVGGRPGGPARR